MLITTALRAIALTLATAFLLSACGGSGGGAPTPVATPAPPIATPPDPALPATGTVGIVLTDAPIFDFDEVLATINSIELLGDDGNAIIFAGNETLDLLRLGSFTELFAVNASVPAGDYNKIRLRLSELTLIRNDMDGIPVDIIPVDLPGNGKIDLNPRGTFTVTPGATLLLELDIDAARSIHITQNGNAQRYRFRPVVFVRVYEGDATDRLARVHGVVDRVIDVPSGFVVCQTDFVADPHEDDDDDMGDDGGMDDDDDMDDDGRCLSVFITQDTGIFGPDGEPVDSSVIMVGDALTAIGDLRGETGDSDSDSSDSDSDSDDDDNDDNVILDAYVIEQGSLGTFERLTGTVASVLSGDEFGLAIAPGQGFGGMTTITARLQPGSRLFDRGGVELDSTALAIGTEGHFEGVLMLSDSMPDVLKIALIVLDLDSATGESLSGTILSVDVAMESLMLGTDNGDRCVLVPPDAILTQVTIADDGTTSDSVTLADLEPDTAADLFGREDVGGCFVVDTLRVEVDITTDINRAPLASAGPPQQVTTGDSVVLDGAGSSDPDGDTLTYNWTLVAPAQSTSTLVGADTVAPSFVADVDGQYTATLVVSDGVESSAPDTTTITAQSMTTLDGAALYMTHCQVCHQPLANSEVSGASASSTQAAIDSNRGNMGGLSFLTPEEIDAIAAALQGQ